MERNKNAELQVRPCRLTTAAAAALNTAETSGGREATGCGRGREKEEESSHHTADGGEDKAIREIAGHAQALSARHQHMTDTYIQGEARVRARDSEQPLQKRARVSSCAAHYACTHATSQGAKTPVERRPYRAVGG